MGRKWVASKYLTFQLSGIGDWQTWALLVAGASCAGGITLPRCRFSLLFVRVRDE
jgi:hypothetical protein